MRTFFNWEILNRIEQSPKEYIVQRNVNVLSAFLYGYDGILLQLENKQTLQQKYNTVPDVGEYALQKYNAVNIGSRNFSSIISFISEGELDFYHNYLAFIKEYETTYPVTEPVRYIVDPEEKSLHEFGNPFPASTSLLHTERKYHPGSLQTLLFGMRKRFPMYFGNYNLALLRAFLDGYFLCKKDYVVPLTAFEEKLKDFTESMVCKRLHLEGEFVTWDRKYRYDRDWQSWGDIDTTKEKEILESFWKEVEVYTGEELNKMM